MLEFLSYTTVRKWVLKWLMISIRLQCSPYTSPLLWKTLSVSESLATTQSAAAAATHGSDARNIALTLWWIGGIKSDGAII